MDKDSGAKSTLKSRKAFLAAGVAAAGLFSVAAFGGNNVSASGVYTGYSYAKLQSLAASGDQGAKDELASRDKNAAALAAKNDSSTPATPIYSSMSKSQLDALAAKGDTAAAAEAAKRSTPAETPSTTPDYQNLGWNQLQALAKSGDTKAQAEIDKRSAKSTPAETPKAPEYQMLGIDALKALAAKGDTKAQAEIDKRNSKSPETPAAKSKYDDLGMKGVQALQNLLKDAEAEKNDSAVAAVKAELTKRGRADLANDDYVPGQGTDEGKGDTTDPTDEGKGDTTGTKDDSKGDTTKDDTKDTDTTKDDTKTSKDATNTTKTGDQAAKDGDSNTSDDKKATATQQPTGTAAAALPTAGDKSDVVASSLGVLAVMGALFGLAGTSLKKRA